MELTAQEKLQKVLSRYRVATLPDIATPVVSTYYTGTRPTKERPTPRVSDQVEPMPNHLEYHKVSGSMPYEERRAAEDHNETVHTQRLCWFAQQIAKLIGWQFQLNSGEDYTRHCAIRLLGPNGASIAVRHYYREKGGKVTLDGNFPRDKDDGCYSDVADKNELTRSIRVSFDRDVRVVAADIKRRLLPDYLKALDLAQQQVTKRNEEIDAREGNVQFFADLLGWDRRHNRNEAYGRDLRVTSIYGNSATLEFRGLPIDLAKKLAEFYIKARASSTRQEETKIA